MRDVHDLIKNITSGASAAHAYIIEGRAGKARADFIKTLVSGLECRAEDATGRPCARCDSCLQVEAGSNPDVVYMSRGGKDGKENYLVEDAHPFMERLSMSAYGRYLIGIIEDAEDLSEKIQNKLLKTLEEPGEGVIILLAASSADELLNTVKSRCSLVRIAEFEGFEEEEEEEADGDFMEGAFMILSQRSAFYEFREFLDKHIKTQNDALKLIGIVEEKLRGAMADGKAVKLCAARLEMAEKTAMEISLGTDKTRALKKMFIELKDESGV